MAMEIGQRGFLGAGSEVLKSYATESQFECKAAHTSTHINEICMVHTQALNTHTDTHWLDAAGRRELNDVPVWIKEN